jgi:GTPase SAR1 family protein
MLVGKGGHGKTTLVHRLKDDFTFNENDLTQGRNDMYVCKTLFKDANLLNG